MTRLLTLLLLLLVTGIGGLLLVPRPAQDIALVDYLPEDTLVFIEWDRAAQAKGHWRLDRVAQTIAPEAWRQLLPRDDENDALFAEARRLIVAGEEFVNRPAVSSLLRRGAAFALLPEPAGQSDFSPFLQWMMAVRVDDGETAQQFEELFGRIRSRQTVGYQGEVLVRLAVDGGQDLLYWRHGNVALVACEQALLRQSIDRSLQRMTRQVAALSTNSAYARLRRLDQEHADLFCYIDLEGLSQRAPLVRELDVAGGGLLPRRLAVSYRAASDTSRVMVIGALVSRESASAFMTRHRLPPPARQPLMASMPRETKFALWTNWFKPKVLWDLARQRAGDDVAGLMAAVGQQLSEATGKSLDDFFDVFGEEFGVMITGQPMAHQSARFLGGLFVAVRDRPAAAVMIDQMMAGLQVITVQSGNLEIASVLLAGGLLQPAYALLDRHLILADSVELVESVRRRLLHGGADGEATAGLDPTHRQGNVAVFLRVGEMAERLTPLLALLARETDERHRMLSLEARRVAREIALPLLALVRNVATGRFQGTLADDTLLMELELTLQQD